MRSWALRQPAQGCANRGPGTPPPAGPPSAAPEHQGSARRGTPRSCRSTRTWSTGSVSDPGRPPLGSSSWRLKSSGWGVERRVPDRRRPPRSSPLPCSSNGASSPRPDRRDLSHIPNPGTWILSTVPATQAATVAPLRHLAHTAVRHYSDVSNHIPTKASPVRPHSHHGPLLPRQVHSLHPLHRPPYSHMSVPPNWDHIPPALLL